MVSRVESRRRLRHAAVAGVFAALLLVLAVIGVLLRRTNLALERSVADQARARASKLVALGRLELDNYPTAALAYARKSLETADTIEGRLLALEALWRGPTARVLPLSRDLDCTRLAFSPDGRRLACSGFQPSVAVFTDDGVLSKVLGGHESLADARAVAFTPDGRDLLTWAPGDPLVRDWSVEDWTPRDIPGEALWLRVTDEGPAVSIGSVGGGRTHVVRSFSPDGGTVNRSWPWTPPAELRFDQPGLRPLAVDRNAQWLLYGRERGIFRHLFEGRGEDEQIGSHDARVRDLLLDAEERRLLSVDETGEFRLWSLPEGTCLRTLRGSPPQRFTLPSFDRAGRRVAWASPDGTHVWDLEDPPDARPLRLPRGDVADFGETTFTRAGRWLATGSFGSAALFPMWFPHARTLQGHLEGPLAFAFTPDSRLLVSCAKDGARIWPLAPGAGAARRIELEGDYYCYGVAVDPKGQALVVVSPFLGVYSVPLGGGAPRKLLDFAHRRLAISATAFDERSRRLAVASHYGDPRDEMLLYVLDLERGTVDTTRLRDPGGQDPWAAGARVLRFDPEGRVIVAGEGGVRRWRPGGAIETIMGGPGSYAVFDASLDSRTLVVLEGAFHLGSSTLSDARITASRHADRRSPDDHGAREEPRARDRHRPPGPARRHRGRPGRRPRGARHGRGAPPAPGPRQSGARARGLAGRAVDRLGRGQRHTPLAHARSLEAALPHPPVRRAHGEAPGADQPAGVGRPRVADRLQDRDRPVPRLEGRADVVTLSGTRLGPYEILEPLGAGGMGEVYRAHDPRLGRDVAVKVILTDDEPSADRLRRFEHEARAVAALTHPNVLAVYDVGTHDGRPYVVSELLEGRDAARAAAHGAAAPALGGRDGGAGGARPRRRPREGDRCTATSSRRTCS